MALSVANAFAADESRPNILFIISDDHSINALGTCKDDTLVPMHSLKRLADEGMVFDRSYCTNSISGPSRASIITGRHSHRNGFLYNYGGAPFNVNQPVWPEMLQKAGYQTGLIGKIHTKNVPNGFDHWEVFPDQGEYWNPRMQRLDKNGKKETFQTKGYSADVLGDKAIEWMKNRDKDKPFALFLGHKAPHRNWIAKPKHLKQIKKVVAGLKPPSTLMDDWSDRPAFLARNEQSISDYYCNWHDSHLIQDLIPFEVMKEIVTKPILRKMVDSGRFKNEIPKNFNWEKHVPKYPAKLNINFNMKPNVPAEHFAVYDKFYSDRTKDFVRDMKAGKIRNKQDMTVLRWQWYMEDYLATLQGMDESITEVLDYLDKAGLAENTLVVYVADQGFYVGEHGLYDKRWIFEESFRMPLIMRWPGKIAAGKRTDALVQNIDYAPTFCELAGADTPENMISFDGKSLTPLFATGEAAGYNDRALYYAFYEQPGEHNAPRHDGIRTDRYTFARIWTTLAGEDPQNRRVEDEWMLIDNEKDPKQMHNVISKPEYAEAAKEMRARYEQTREHFKVAPDCPGNGPRPAGYPPTWNKLEDK